MKLTTQKDAELRARMEKLAIHEEEIVEKFILGAGRGGQKVNKTASCVYLKHLPTGIEVKCNRDRSQAMNRFFARRELCYRMEANVLGERSRRQQEQEKIRRQKRRRSRRSKQRMLDDKHKQSEKKARRRSLPPD